ncbi:MAG: 16S rRNA methyltransferase [Treponema sp.]|jgi:16S rRNA (cytosine1407-C5)-methyltransferase|nr:16S rRNA methyltransferase [Treponema sp.]
MVLVNQAFEEYYQNLYGRRWGSLRASLLASAPAVPYTQGLRKPYYLDRGSIIAAQTLPLPAGGLILDACAAPGGKSLVILSRMPKDAKLLANELSRERRRRLHKTLDAHLDGDTRSQARITGFDAAALAAKPGERNRFDGILLDVPCSSEAHILCNPRRLAQWTAARPRFLAKRQWSLLSAAFLLLKPGGALVYVTCALSQEENDGVAARLERKYGAALMAEEPAFHEGEKTRYGRILLPDAGGGIGPIYAARFRKRAVLP